MFCIFHAQRSLDRDAISIRIRVRCLSQNANPNWRSLQQTRPEGPNTRSHLSHPVHIRSLIAIHEYAFSPLGHGNRDLGKHASLQQTPQIP